MLFNGKRVYKNAFLYQVNFHDTESALFVSRIVGKSVCVFIFETGMENGVAFWLVCNFLLLFCRPICRHRVFSIVFYKA